MSEQNTPDFNTTNLYDYWKAIITNYLKDDAETQDPEGDHPLYFVNVTTWFEERWEKIRHNITDPKDVDDGTNFNIVIATFIDLGFIVSRYDSLELKFEYLTGDDTPKPNDFLAFNTKVFEIALNPNQDQGDQQ